MSSNSSGVSTASPKSRLRRLLQNLALSVGVFLLCALACEIALRWAGYGNLEIYEPDPKLYWKLKPNQDCFTKVDHRPVHINALGTRGPEFQMEKPAGTFRILSLGDSRTFGWGLADEETYSRRLEHLLKEFQGANIQHPTSNIQHPIREKPLTPALSPSAGEKGNRDQSVREARRVAKVFSTDFLLWSGAAVYPKSWNFTSYGRYLSRKPFAPAVRRRPLERHRQ